MCPLHQMLNTMRPSRQPSECLVKLESLLSYCLIKYFQIQVKMDSSSWTTACGYITFNFKLLFLFNILHCKCFLAYENDTWHYSKTTLKKVLFPTHQSSYVKFYCLLWNIILLNSVVMQYNTTNKLQPQIIAFYITLGYLGILKSL